jgi:hypothetical protein
MPSRGNAVTRGLLVAGFDASPVRPDEFDDWYDTEHLPERRAIEGFLRCERWIGAEHPRLSIATYDLASLDVLNSAAYRAIAGDNLSAWSKRVIGRSKRLCRFEAEEITKAASGRSPADDAAGGLLLFAMNVAPEAEADFNAWYDDEHVPRLAAVPGCLSARRFRIVSAVSEGAQRYLALYRLESPDVCASEAWRQAAVTPWTLRVRPHTKDRLRIVLARYARA